MPAALCAGNIGSKCFIRTHVHVSLHYSRRPRPQVYTWKLYPAGGLRSCPQLMAEIRSISIKYRAHVGSLDALRERVRKRVDEGQAQERSFRRARIAVGFVLNVLDFFFDQDRPLFSAMCSLLPEGRQKNYGYCNTTHYFQPLRVIEKGVRSIV